MNDDQKFFIPANLTDNRKFFGIQNRNLIETGVIELVLFIIIRLLPLVIGAKAMLAAILMIPAGIIAIIGIKNESLTEFIISTMLFNRNKKSMHFKRPDQTMLEDKEVKKDSEPVKKDIVQRFLDIVTLRRNDDSEEEPEEEPEDIEKE